MLRNSRLKSNKGLKSTSELSSSSSFKKSSGFKKSGKSKFKTNHKAISDDDAFYLSIWDSREHVCAECGIYLGDQVTDENGRVIIRIYFSHILQKGGLYARFRRDPRNIDLLCGEHHAKWEDQTLRKTMKIYPKNLKIMQELINEKNNGIL